jgi:hypothetical protein
MKTVRIIITIGLLLPLLLVSTTFAAPAAAEKQWRLKGSLEANETSTLAFPTLSVTGTGSGHATHLGRFTITYQVSVDIRTGAGVASVQLVAANGDSLLAAGTGQSTPTGTPGVVQIEEQYTVTGGTGRFAGARANFTVERLLNRPTGISSGTLTGDIVVP